GGEAKRRLVVERRARRDQRARLRGKRVGNDRRTMPQAVHRPSLYEVEVALAGVIVEPGPGAPHEDEGGPLCDGHQVSGIDPAPSPSARGAAAAVSRRASARATRSPRVAMKIVSSPAMAPTASERPASSRARASGAAAAGGVFTTTRLPAACADSAKPRRA